MPQENDADQSHHNAFLNQFFTQGGDGTLDQIAAVVSRHDMDAFQAAMTVNLLQLLLHPLNHAQRIFTVTHHHNAAHRLAFSVHSSATPRRRSGIPRWTIPTLFPYIHGCAILFMTFSGMFSGCPPRS